MTKMKVPGENMQNPWRMVSLIIVVCVTLVMPQQLWSASEFELDLKEFKKPSTPLPSFTQQKKYKKTYKRRYGSSKYAVNREKNPDNLKLQQALTLEPVIAVAPSELALKGGNACRLAEQMAVAVARPVPADSLLHGLSLKTVAAVNASGVNVLVTCGIPPAEAYTFERLLAFHSVQLLNINGDESDSEVSDKVNQALGLTFMIEKDDISINGDLIYLYPAGTDRQRALRLMVQP